MLLWPAQDHAPVKVSSGIFKLRLNPGNVHPWPARIQTAALSGLQGWLLTSAKPDSKGRMLVWRRTRTREDLWRSRYQRPGSAKR
jgi:hypothetical protein